jgi:hypothetical protein
LVENEELILVSMLVTVTAAEGTTAPEASVTVPRMEPVVDCAGRIPPVAAIPKHSIKIRGTAFLIARSSFGVKVAAAANRASEHQTLVESV